MMVSRTEGDIDDSLIGGNASAEGPEGEGTEHSNHWCRYCHEPSLAENQLQKRSLQGVHQRLHEVSQRETWRTGTRKSKKPSVTGAAEQIKHILANFKDCPFFIGENVNLDGMVALLDYCADAVTPHMIFFKDDLEMEKC